MAVVTRDSFEQDTAPVYGFVPHAFGPDKGIYIRAYSLAEYNGWLRAAKATEADPNAAGVNDLELLACLLTGPEPPAIKLQAELDDLDDQLDAVKATLAELTEDDEAAQADLAALSARRELLVKQLDEAELPPFEDLTPLFDGKPTLGNLKRIRRLPGHRAQRLENAIDVLSGILEGEAELLKGHPTNGPSSAAGASPDSAGSPAS